jgi:hypothetical protein
MSGVSRHRSGSRRLAVPGLTVRDLRARLLVLAALTTLGTVTLSAQAAGAGDPTFPRWEIGPYVGIARHSPVGTHLGVMPDRNHVFVGLQLTATVVRSRRWAFGFAPEIVPLLLVSNNPTYRTISVPDGRRFSIEDGRGSVAGFAISPIALQGQVRIASRWRAYAAGAGGVVWFTRNVPVAQARAFNYTFEAGGGVRWQYRSRQSLRVGYKFHHLSNAYSAPANPGIDAAVFLVAYERAFGAKRQLNEP